MSAPDEDLGGFAPPPWNAANALVQLKRALRELKLAERGNAYELRGRRVLELQPEAAAIAVRLARKPTVAPEWDRMTIGDATAQRQLIDETKKRLQRWEREE